MLTRPLDAIYRLLEDAHERRKQREWHERYDLALNCKFGPRCELYGEGAIHIGEGTYLGHGCTIQAYRNQEVRIGRWCDISHRLSIYTCNRASDAWWRFTRGDVRIGDEVWIGINVTILEGVTIGDRAVIGAHALVNCDIPEGCVAVGVPARVVKVGL